MKDKLKGAAGSGEVEKYRFCPTCQHEIDSKPNCDCICHTLDVPDISEEEATKILAEAGIDTEDLMNNFCHRLIDKMRSTQAELEAERAKVEKLEKGIATMWTVRWNKSEFNWNKSEFQAFLIEAEAQALAKELDENGWLDVRVEPTYGQSDGIASLQAELEKVKGERDEIIKALPASWNSELPLPDRIRAIIGYYAHEMPSRQHQITSLTSSLTQLRQEKEQAEKERKALLASALEFFSKSFCDRHGEEIKAMSFPEFAQSRFQSCVGCEIENRLQAEKVAVEFAKAVFDELTTPYGGMGWRMVLSDYSVPVVERLIQDGFVEQNGLFRWYRWREVKKEGG